MLTKRANGFVGYGFTDEEALDSCKIISMLKGAYNIKGFPDMVEKHTKLAPWFPRKTSLHMSGIGLITVKDHKLCVNEKSTKINNSIFEALYKCFYGKLSMVDISVCATEIQQFLSSNKIEFNAFDSYEQVTFEDVFFEDEDILFNAVTDEYSIVLWSTGRVGIKRNSEELYSVCSYDKDKCSTTDILYYMAYVRDYPNMDEVMEAL